MYKFNQFHHDYFAMDSHTPYLAPYTLQQQQQQKKPFELSRKSVRVHCPIGLHVVLICAFVQKQNLFLILQQTT